MRRPRRRSRLIRSTTSGVTFKSPPRRRLGVLYRRISAPEPQSYRLLDSVGRYVEPGQGVVSDERLATYLNQGKIRHVDTSQHGSGDRRVVCRPNPRARLKLLQLPSVESSADAGSRWLRCPGESASMKIGRVARSNRSRGEAPVASPSSGGPLQLKFRVCRGAKARKNIAPAAVIRPQ